MIKRLTITVAAAALLVVPTQSTSAATPKPVGPAAEAQDKAVAQPTSKQGLGNSPGVTEPDAAEAVPSGSAERGISTSPGSVEPVAESPPAYEPAQKDKEGEEEPTEEECAHRDALAEEAMAKWLAYDRLADAFEGTLMGGFLADEAAGWAREVKGLIETQQETGCHIPMV